MYAEIISVGTELTTGASLDTNSQWLSLELAAIGIPVSYHTTVADDMAALVGVIRTAAQRSEIIILTGGLGPTLDDLTRQALAEVLGVELVLDPASLEFIRALFARFKREMPERNVIQAHFPAGTQPIPNLRGTAPGIWARIPRPGGGESLFAALPGVPSEMKRMFAQEVVPRLPTGSRVIRRARINCFGVGESQAEAMLGDLTARGRDPEIGITVHEATITLRIVAHGDTVDACDSKIAAAKSAIRERMGDLVFGEEDEELEHVVLRLLRERGNTLATAEIGTGGLLARRITEVPGYENVFRGGIVASSLEGLAKVVDSPAEADKRAAIAATLENSRQHWGADFVIFVGAFPHYDPDNPAQAAPTSEVALAGPNVSRIVDYTFLGDATLNRSRAAKIALNLLRLHFLRGKAV
ncbi:MAG TPA: CinA family nicotinamide mononucleotide deamidase-related protein [Planctomycetaceae bacterium]|nr:CinA family nicotinamide mononucleotide deamidase-related protein [Planctomycetaceae bacterium]